MSTKRKLAVLVAALSLVVLTAGVAYAETATMTVPVGRCRWRRPM